MLNSASAVSAPRARKSVRALFGGFGWPEKAAGIETCPQKDDTGEQALATDLYCRCTQHDRFLPFVRTWSNGARVTAVLAGSALIYGCFALAAQLDSWIPLFVVYALIGLSAVALPLRLFPLTVRLTIVIWLVASAGALVYHFSGSRAHAIMATALLVAAGCALGLHAVTRSVQDILAGKAVSNDRQRSLGALAFVTGAVATAAAAGAIALALLLVPRVLESGAAELRSAALITAIAAIVLAALGAAAAGLFDGIPRISTRPGSIQIWPGPRKVTWRAERKVIRSGRIRTFGDRIGDVTRRVLIRMGNALASFSTDAARISVNLVFTAVRLMANGLIHFLNFMIWLITITVRAILSAATSTWWFLTRSVTQAVLHAFYAATAAGIPAAALFLAAGLTSSAAGQMLRYLVAGSIAALLGFAVTAVLGMAALTTAWITLASQPLGPSLRSARQSATVTGPYGLLFVAAGGWVVGLPGTLGPGRIHVGWVTLASTAILAVALIWSQVQARQDKAEQPAGVAAGQDVRPSERSGGSRRVRG